MLSLFAFISLLHIGFAQEESAAVPTEEAEVEGEASIMDNIKKVEWWRWILIVCLIILSGCFSGLNLGVLGLDTKDLEMM